MIRSTASTALATISFLSLSVALASGCSTKSTSDETAGAGEDVSQTESDTASLATLHVGSTTSGSLAPAMVEDGSGGIRVMGLVPMTGGLAGYLEPAGCLTETTDAIDSKVTYTYADCTGPYGLVHLTGTVAVTYSSTGPDNLTLDFSSTGFQINKATLSSWTATAVITSSSSSRTMIWNAQLSGTTGSGRQFTRTNAKTITWTTDASPQCVSISGTAQGTVTGEDLKTTIVSYQRCADACPQAGGEIQIQNEDDGNSVDIKYDGGPKATVTETTHSGTASITIPLACGLL